jgi:hypothetical protein
MIERLSDRVNGHPSEFWTQRLVVGLVVLGYATCIDIDLVCSVDRYVFSAIVE